MISNASGKYAISSPTVVYPAAQAAPAAGCAATTNGFGNGLYSPLSTAAARVPMGPPSCQAFSSPASSIGTAYTNAAAAPGRVVTQALSRERLHTGFLNADAARDTCVPKDRFNATFKRDALGGALALRNLFAPITGGWDTIVYSVLGAPANGLLQGAIGAGRAEGAFLGNATDGRRARSLNYPMGASPCATSTSAVGGETGAAVAGGLFLAPTIAMTGVGTILSAAPKLVLEGVGGTLGAAFGVLHGLASLKKSSTEAPCATTPVANKAVDGKACDGKAVAPASGKDYAPATGLSPKQYAAANKI